jgi:DNA modification methylase
MTTPYHYDKFNLFLDGELVTEIANLVITTPPHDLTISYDDNLFFGFRWLHSCLKWLKPGGLICLGVPLTIDHDGRQSIGADYTELAKQVGFQYVKCVPCTRRAAPIEMIIILSKCGPGTAQRADKLARLEGDSLAISQRLIQHLSARGHTILVLFQSGSKQIAAEAMDRQCIVISLIEP